MYKILIIYKVVHKNFTWCELMHRFFTFDYCTIFFTVIQSVNEREHKGKNLKEKGVDYD